MYVGYDELDGYGPSGRVWKKFGRDGILAFSDPRVGYGYFDHFLKFGNTSLYDGYLILVDAICTVAQITSEANHPGIVRLSIVGDTSEDEAVLQFGNALDVGTFLFADKVLCFETAVRVSAITAAKWGWFAGLATGGAAGAGITDQLLAADGSVFATNSFVGFQKLFAEGAALDGMYQLSGQTKVDGAVNTDLDTIHTLVADTWVKLGLRYDPLPKRLGWYVNGVEVASIGAAALDAAAFPDAVYMQPTFGAKDEAGDAALTLDIDWWGCAQLA
jgi:hypothetical protein